MISITQESVNQIVVEKEWNFSSESELLMHTIHAYPAKFPAFIAKKAFEYAESEKVNVESVADVFCGCGTVALEAKLHNKKFWGCDLNPVATLIAKVKSESYDLGDIEKYYSIISKTYQATEPDKAAYANANERLRYWFSDSSFCELSRLKTAIKKSVPEGKYQDAFFCLFSAILKASSRWLTKSIKPQVDPNKKEIDVWNTFEYQYNKFVSAVKQIEYKNGSDYSVVIKTESFLTAKDTPLVDLIISSPPYVTSYEYADLHQLSTLWLEYADDYRDLRKGSIGSQYNNTDYIIDHDSLNSIGKIIVSELERSKCNAAKTRSVAKYYIDIQHAIERCYDMLSQNGMAFFVVGDTEYKGVKVQNSSHLIQAMMDTGFTNIKAAKRRISNKILTPYRDEFGRFSSDKTSRTIYHEEYIISGRKCNI